MEINASKITNIAVTLQALEIFYVAGILDNSSAEILFPERVLHSCLGLVFFPPIKFKIQFFYTAATGDMPAYQIRTPTTALPQGVVMAASPGTLHSPQQLAEEATRKRELRLLKNR